MSIEYYFCIYSLIKGWLLGACSSLIVNSSGFFFFFFFLAMPLGFRILVPQPGIEPGDLAVKEWNLKPLDCQKAPFTSFLDLNFGSPLNLNWGSLLSESFASFSAHSQRTTQT